VYCVRFSLTTPYHKTVWTVNENIFAENDIDISFFLCYYIHVGTKSERRFAP